VRASSEGVSTLSSFGCIEFFCERGSVRSYPLLLWLLILLSGSLLPASAQPQRSDETDIADVKAKLAREVEHLATQNYRELDRTEVELLERGKPESFPVELNSNTVYAIVAACDLACEHIVITLRDAKGEVLMQSPEQHHTVIIQGAPKESGEHSIEVSVPGCKTAECYVGVVVLSQARSKRGEAGFKASSG
jgi:hypothetical protein